MRTFYRSLLTTVAVVGVMSFSASLASAQYPNPVVNGHISDQRFYDPWNDSWFVDQSRTRMRASAYDPARSVVDPGSVQHVNRYVQDPQGSWWLEQGTTWRSYGVPHGNVSRTRYQAQPGVVTRQRDNILYDTDE